MFECASRLFDWKRRALSTWQRSPTIWLGQSVDTSSICSNYSELRKHPFLTSLGCAIRRPSLRETHFNSTLRTRLGVTGPLMVDSGGFALLMNPKARWNVRSVAKSIEKIEANVFVSLDYPPSPNDTASERRHKIILSSKNFEILCDSFPHKTIMPVVHGRTLSEIELSVKLFAKKCCHLSWIGLGGIVPLLKHVRTSKEISSIGPESFIARALQIVREANPHSRIHAFGAGGTRTFPALFAFGADSADSIGWRQAAGYGSIFLPLKSQRTVKWNKKKRAPRKPLDESDIVQLQACRCPICRSASSAAVRISALHTDFHNRSIHNAWVIANQFKYWPSTRNEMLSFIVAGGLGAQWAKATETYRA